MPELFETKFGRKGLGLPCCWLSAYLCRRCSLDESFLSSNRVCTRYGPSGSQFRRAKLSRPEEPPNATAASRTLAWSAHISCYTSASWVHRMAWIFCQSRLNNGVATPRPSRHTFSYLIGSGPELNRFDHGSRLFFRIVVSCRLFQNLPELKGNENTRL